MTGNDRKRPTAEELEVIDLSDMASPPCSMPVIEPLPGMTFEKDKQMTAVPIGVLVSSDRAFAGTYEDKGGPGIEAYLKDVLTTPWRSVKKIVPDERAALATALIEMADKERCPRCSSI